jgi:vacuolar-type H+-ATPase subunit F/Vma7
LGTFAVLGEEARVATFGLGGAVVVPADGPEAVRAAWAALSEETAVVLLTAAAADALGGGGDAAAGRLVVVMPT